jgi:hypothetical protein
MPHRKNRCVFWNTAMATADAVKQRLEAIKEQLNILAVHVATERAIWDEVRSVRDRAIAAQKALDVRFELDMAAMRQDLEALQEAVKQL